MLSRFEKGTLLTNYFAGATLQGGMGVKVSWQSVVKIILAKDDEGLSQGCGSDSDSFLEVSSQMITNQVA